MKLITENDWCGKFKVNQRLVSNWFIPRFCQLLLKKGGRGNDLVTEARQERVTPTGGICWSAGIWLLWRVSTGGASVPSQTQKHGVACGWPNANSENKTGYTLRSRTINTNISSYWMVHDFGETILCDAINFKHKTFILNSLSNESLKGNCCPTKPSNRWQGKRKHALDAFLPSCGKVHRLGGAESKQLTTARAE